MFYNHLSKNERNLIDFLFNKGKNSISQIARSLGRNKSTISRELKRNCHDGVYCYEIAESKTIERKKHKYFFMYREYSEFTNHFIKMYDKRYHGVYQTVHKISQEYPDINHVSARQVFNWIKTNKWSVKKSDRLRQYYKKGGKRTLGIFSRFKNRLVLPYWTRPKSIDLREEYGHWEADLIIGKRSTNFDNLLTLTERKTRILFTCRIKTKNPMKVNSAMYKLIKNNNLLVKSITVDNGIEFQKIGLLASWLKCVVYFCEPYASYQRGTNENINGMIRRTWSKGTDFSLVSDDELNKVAEFINEMPRKMFNWKSSADIFRLETSK